MRSKTRVYATLTKTYPTQTLVGMGFVRDGSRMVKRGAMRTERAVATSLDGLVWRVTPLERGWKS